MRLIDAEAFEEEIVKTMRYVPKDAVLDVACMVNRAPTIEAKPVVHAHWEEIANGFMVCSHCKESVEENRKYSYCPICGAQMDELVSNTDELNSSVVLEENATTTNNTQEVSVDNHIARGGKKGIKIPVISMEDVPKLAKEMEK